MSIINEHSLQLSLNAAHDEIDQLRKALVKAKAIIRNWENEDISAASCCAANEMAAEQAKEELQVAIKKLRKQRILSRKY